MELRRWKGMVKIVAIVWTRMNRRRGKSASGVEVESTLNTAEVTNVVMTGAR